MLREEIKQKIRKQKEELLLLEIELKNIESDSKIEEKITKINNEISLYDKYGSKDW